MSKEEYGRIMAEIETLPGGGITYKKINGREYAYYQWREAGRQHSRRAKGEELEMLTKQIERRKELQNLLKQITREEAEGIKPAWQFHCPVRIGEELDRFVKPVSGWKRRECYQHLRAYIYGDMQDREYSLVQTQHFSQR